MAGTLQSLTLTSPLAGAPLSQPRRYSHFSIATVPVSGGRSRSLVTRKLPSVALIIRASQQFDQANDGPNQPPRATSFANFSSLGKPLLNFASNNFLPLGLALFSCMPTTLSSGVALTRLAGGNSALALAMTVISNLLGILIVPFTISKFIAAGVGASVPTKELFRSLCLTLLFPLILGKVFRESFQGLADFADRNRKLLSVISAILLSLVPWIQVSRSRPLLLMVKPAVFLVAVGLGGGQGWQLVDSARSESVGKVSAG